MIDFAGKVAVITGAASGIGLACARLLAREGMAVALLDVRADALDRAVLEVRSMGADAVGIITDVSDEAAVEAAADEVVRVFGKVHLLMNNAAVFIRGPAVSMAADDVWDWLLRVNLYGPIHGIRAFLPRIREHGEGGHIINTASISGFLVGPRRNGIYSTAKFALVGLTEALAQELVGTNIQASVIMPAAVSTEFYETSAQHRGDLGGPNEFPTAPPDTAAGMSADEVAARMLAGIKSGQFYIATHADMRAPLEARHRAIMAAYDAAEGWTGSADGQAK